MVSTMEITPQSRGNSVKNKEHNLFEYDFLMVGCEERCLPPTQISIWTVYVHVCCIDLLKNEDYPTFLYISLQVYVLLKMACGCVSIAFLSLEKGTLEKD